MTPNARRSAGASGAVVNVSYTLFDATGAGDGRHLAAETIGGDSGTLRLGSGVIFGDAALASPTLASTNLIVGTTAKIQSLAGIHVLHYDVGRIAEVLAFDVHPRSKAGRWTAAGYVRNNEWSPAIDAGNPADAVCGEPKPNGARINLGRFGGTAQASLSKRIGLIILMR